MMKTDNLNQLRQLRIKVEKLINLHKQLQEENKRLIISDIELKKNKVDLQKQVEELEEKNKVLKLAKSFSGTDQNSREIKLKINEYIREIDKCLALINR